MYQGHDEPDKRIKLLFDEVKHHYHVIGNLTGDMAKRYVCEGCNKGCEYGVVHTCEQSCSDCMLRPPCISTGIRMPCHLCNRHFKSQTCFDNHKRKTQGKRKGACELRKCCATCVAMITRNTHECHKRFCATCKENKEAGHLSYMRPLVDDLLNDAYSRGLVWDLFTKGSHHQRHPYHTEHISAVQALSRHFPKS
jgi:hypothetical protein